MAVSKEQIDRVIELATAYGATRIVLFGSAAENPEDARDIDIACDGIPGWKIFELAARLEDELGTALDIVPLTPPNSFTRHIERKGRVLV
jgi:predicted nucleotidyltransferase